MKTSASIRGFFSVVAFLVCATGVARANPGDLYVSAGGKIVAIAPDGTQSTYIAIAPSGVRGIAFSHAGELFVSDTSGEIIQYTQRKNSSVFVAGLSVPQGIAYDTAGNLFESDLGTNSILQISPTGVTKSFATGVNSPEALAFDNNGNLYVTTADAGGSILKFSGGVKSTVISGLGNPFGLAFDSAGNLFVTDSVAGTISKISPTGTKSPFAAGLNNPMGLAFDNSGNLYVMDGAAGSILKFAANGTRTTFVSGLTNPSSFIAFEPTIDKLRNLSTRGAVLSGDSVLIAGIIVGGNALNNNAVLIRALGPTLGRPPFNVNGALADPTLELHDSSGAVIAVNNDWQDTQAAQIMATGKAPPDPKEAAISIVLQAGDYTAIVRGVGNSTGNALVEVYNLP